VVFLSDWTDTDPKTLFSNLKQQSNYYNYHRYTLPNFISAVKEKGLGATISDRLAWAKMNMSPRDILYVTGATYTYLMNGNAPNTNWTGLFQSGERIRLRFINGSSMTSFDVRIPGLPITVVQADGNNVEPVTVDEFRINVAETYDVIVQPKDNAAYTIFAQSMDRSGFARGTLAPRMGMTAAVPPMDPVLTRPMSDMGMEMGSMKGIKKGKEMEMGGMSGMDMSGVDGMKKSDMPASSESPGENGKQSMAGMNMSSDAAKRNMSPAHEDRNDMGTMRGMEMGNSAGTIPFPQPWSNTMPIMSMSPTAMKNAEAHLQPSNPVHLHTGPQVDNVAMEVSERLNEPGLGLNGNGRRVLTYADLKARYRGVDGRPPTREIELHLTGNMERFIWGFNGEKFASAQPIELKLGERLRIVLINDTMMEHPIHLHGLWSELENGHGAFNPYKHTINVKPAERVSYLVSADTPGHWAFHCHLVYHMEAGMFRTVVVS
jgi:FtsP/CotA-like multicopper oxidase with cupredoxin domain